MHENVIICLDGRESNIGTEQVGSGFFTREGLISGCSSKFDGWRRVRRVFLLTRQMERVTGGNVDEKAVLRFMNKCKHNTMQLLRLVISFRFGWG